MNRYITIVLAAIALVAGCSSQKPENAAPSTPYTTAVANQSIADTQNQIMKVQNDPSIPPATKEAIVAHLQGDLSRTKAANPTATGASAQ
jgi:hypothetical protein